MGPEIRRQQNGSASTARWDVYLKNWWCADRGRTVVGGSRQRFVRELISLSTMGLKGVVVTELVVSMAVH